MNFTKYAFGGPWWNIPLFLRKDNPLEQIRDQRILLPKYHLKASFALSRSLGKMQGL